MADGRMLGSNVFWSAVAALATLSGTVIVLFGAIFALRQVREAAKARSLQSYLAIMDRIDAPNLRSARWLVYAHHKELSQVIRKNPSTRQLDRYLRRLTRDEVNLAILRTYLASLENIAILVMHNLAPDDLIELYLGSLVPHHWNALRDFTVYMRAKYNSDDYLQHFEMLVKLMDADGLDLSWRARSFRSMHIWGHEARRSKRIKRQIIRKREEARDRLRSPIEADSV